MSRTGSMGSRVVLLLLTLAGCVAPADQPRGGIPPAFAAEREKEVVCVVEQLPNYITHLTAVAGLPWRTAYADAFGHTVDLESHQILQRHAPMLQWGHGLTGDLAPFFVLLPAYLPLEDEFDLFEYMRAVDVAMSSRRYAPIGDLYPRAHARLSWWLFDFEGFFHSRSEVYQTYLRAVRQLVHVFEYNYELWEEEVWHDIELDLELVAHDMNGDLWSLDLLAKWERLTGERFRGSRYEIVLTAAPAGTGITSLGYHRSLLSTDMDQDRMLGLIVHEVGTHLLVDLYREMSDRDLAAGETDWTTFAAYAGLTAYYTRQILPEFETEIENDVEIFAGIYQQLADEEPEAGARRLMARALAEKRSGRW
jgi:hypothetical protein